MFLKLLKVQWVTVVTISGLCSHNKKSRENCVLCAGCNKKETVCTRAFIDVRVKINDAN